MRRWDTNRILLFLLATILFANCVLKFFALIFDPFAEFRYAIPLGLLWTSVVIELTVAAFLCFSSASDILKWLCVAVVFGCFTLASIIRSSFGIANCGCFGAVSVSPVIATIVCGLVAIGSITHLIRSRRSDESSEGTANELYELWFEHKITIVGLSAFCVLVFLITEKRIEDWGDVIVNGPEPLLVVAERRHEVVANEESFIDFQLHNRSDEVVELVGVNSSCACLGIGKFSGTIEPRQSRPFRVRLAKTTTGTFRERLLIYTDSGRQPVVAVDFFGSSVEK